MGLKRTKKDPGSDAGEVSTAAGGGDRPRGGKNLAVPVACLAIGALLGPKVLGTGDAAQAAPTDPADAAGVVELGPVVVLEPVTVNLGDGHLLKVGLALQLSADAEHGKDDGHGGAEDPTQGFAVAIDAAITSLGRHSMPELIDPVGRHDAKAELVEQVSEVTHGDVVDVYFHQFVMM